jgi:hypothetical protein
LLCATIEKPSLNHTDYRDSNRHGEMETHDTTSLRFYSLTGSGRSQTRHAGGRAIGAFQTRSYYSIQAVWRADRPLVVVRATPVD